MSPARGLYLARAVKILSPLTAGCESTLREKEPASGYKLIEFDKDERARLFKIPRFFQSNRNLIKGNYRKHHFSNKKYPAVIIQVLCYVNKSCDAVKRMECRNSQAANYFSSLAAKAHKDEYPAKRCKSSKNMQINTNTKG